jgi:molecular chaperone HscB
MNYFEFYNLPISFTPDANAVKAKFYELSKKYHPDFYANESEDKQQEVLELSTINNKAYQTLSNPQKRLKYLLELKGIVVEEESYQLPQSFLMEMMDVNEALMELEFEVDPTKLLELNKQVDELEYKLLDEQKVLIDTYDKDTQTEDLLLKIKDIYYRLKYVARLKERLVKN